MERVLRCPVCKAEGVGAVCRRCKADLSLLVALESARAHALALAVNTQDAAEVLRQAQIAHQLRADETSWRRLALAHLFLRQFPQALACRQRATPVE